MQSKKKIAAWSSYWSEGNITSLPNLFADNYGGDVLRFWNDAFAGLKEDGRVLDICTGNGAIALLVSEYAKRRDMDCDIHAIDIAKIQPVDLRGDITFHPGVAVELTHFPDDYFDLVVGQFGLEYCDLPDAIKELSRITGETGTVVVMMHHAESVTAKKTQEFIGITDVFLKEPTIFFRLRKYAEQLLRQKKPDAAKVAQTRKQMIASLDTANELLRRLPRNRFLRLTLDHVNQFIERIHNEPPVQISEIREFERTVKNHLVRMQDQRNASLTAADVAKIEEFFVECGFQSVDYQPYYLDGVLFSWTLKAQRGNAA